MKISDPLSYEEENSQLRNQIATLEELLQVYEQTATEQEQRLNDALASLQERAEQLTHAQETLQTLKAILESMGDAVVVNSSDGKQLFSNSAAQALFQGQEHTLYLDNESETYRLYKQDPTSPQPETHLPLHKLAQGKSMEGVELQLIVPETGQNQWLSANTCPLHAMEDQLTGGVAVFRDITKRKLVEQALQQAHQKQRQQTQLLENTLQELRETQTQLIHGEKMAGLGRTVAGIAHEINNPVNFIYGNINHAQHAFQELLELVHQFQVAYPQPPAEIVKLITAMDLGFLATDVPKLLDSIQLGATRIRDIVISLRSFSRLDEADFKQVDLHDGLDSTLTILRSQLQAHPHRPAIDLVKHYGQIPLIECHASQINQVFNHLLSNAIDAVNEGIPRPQITIATGVKEQTIEICITDNGIGIKDEVRSQIFDPFFTTKPVGKGTGLGLAICHQIVVKGHHGQLTINSQDHQGTQVVITLPRHDYPSIKHPGSPPILCG